MTDLFSFVLVMVSLVLAIGLAHLVHGVVDRVRVGGPGRLEPIALVWAASLFLVAAIYWWSLWDVRQADWTFPLFFFLLLAPTLLHVAASLLVSPVPDAAGAASAFDAVRVPFMVTMAVFSVVVTVDGWLLGAEGPWTPYRPVQLWSVGAYAVGAVVPGRWTQRVIAGLMLATYLAAGFVFRFIPGAFGS